MLLEPLADRFPDLWHVTFPGAWEGIRANGFLRAVDVHPEGAGQHRGEVRAVPGAGGSTVTLRDQLTSRKDPTPNLDGVTPEEWWQLVNGRVYFFPRQADAEALVASYTAKGQAQEVIKLRTRKLLGPVGDLVELTKVNAGVFPRTNGPSRGRGTFVPMAAYPDRDATKVREVTVAGPIPFLEDAVSTVVAHDADGTRRRLYPVARS